MQRKDMAHGHFGGMQVACLLWQRVCSEKFPSRTSLSGGFGKEAFLCVPLLLGSKRAVSPKCGHEPWSWLSRTASTAPSSETGSAGSVCLLSLTGPSTYRLPAGSKVGSVRRRSWPISMRAVGPPIWVMRIWSKGAWLMLFLSSCCLPHFYQHYEGLTVGP